MYGKNHIRILVEYEDSEKPLADLLGRVDDDLEYLLVVSVRDIYLPARAKLLSASEGARITGREDMRTFADVCRVITERATEKGLVALALLASHNRASAFGVLGDAVTQTAINRWVLQKLEGDGRISDPDRRLIYGKAWFGLVENDSEFRKGVSLLQWYASVELSEKEQDPDFAGRAIRFVQEVRSQRDPCGFDWSSCHDLLQRAAAHEASKKGQRNKAWALLDQEFKPTP